MTRQQIESTRKLLRWKNRMQEANTKVDQNLKRLSSMAGMTAATAALSVEEGGGDSMMAIADAASHGPGLATADQTMVKKQKLMSSGGSHRQGAMPPPPPAPVYPGQQQLQLNLQLQKQQQLNDFVRRKLGGVGGIPAWDPAQPPSTSVGVAVKVKLEPATDNAMAMGGSTNNKRRCLPPVPVYRNLSGSCNSSGGEEEGDEGQKRDPLAPGGKGDEEAALLAVQITQAAEANATSAGGGEGMGMLKKLLLLQYNLEECYNDTGDEEYNEFAGTVSGMCVRAVVRAR
jgi:hypothetical protein